MNEREQVVSTVADQLTAADVAHPLRVGVDGPCGSGKSTLARELVAALAARGQPAVHLDSDGFHHPRAVRYRQGRSSPRGYYEDAYDFDSLVHRVLVPLGPQGSRAYATKVHDMATDRVETDSVATAPENAIVVFDCTFLQRGSLREHWDEVIYLDVPRDIAVARGAVRDAGILGGVEAARQAYEDRYMASCDIYIAEEDPVGRASILIDNADVHSPRVVRGNELFPGSS